MDFQFSVFERFVYRSPCYINSKIVNNFFFVFSIAHTIHEMVTEQATIMINGKLKEYQIKVSCNVLGVSPWNCTKSQQDIISLINVIYFSLCQQVSTLVCLACLFTFPGHNFVFSSLTVGWLVYNILWFHRGWSGLSRSSTTISMGYLQTRWVLEKPSRLSD